MNFKGGVCSPWGTKEFAKVQQDQASSGKLLGGGGGWGTAVGGAWLWSIPDSFRCSRRPAHPLSQALDPLPAPTTPRAIEGTWRTPPASFLSRWESLHSRHPDQAPNQTYWLPFWCSKSTFPDGGGLGGRGQKNKIKFQKHFIFLIKIKNLILGKAGQRQWPDRLWWRIGLVSRWAPERFFDLDLE